MLQLVNMDLILIKALFIIFYINYLKSNYTGQISVVE